MGLVFAPEERDVYSYRAPPNLAPIGAKPDSETIAETSKRGGAPTSFGIEKDPQAIYISPLRGEAAKNVPFVLRNGIRDLLSADFFVRMKSQN